MEHATGTLCWIDLQTPDMDAARRFYADVLGWRWQIGGPEFHHYSQAFLGDDVVAGLGPMQAEGGRPAWTVYFKAGDADGLVAAIAESGGAALMPPMDVADFGRMALVTDPAGAVFGLWQPNTHRGAQRMGTHGAPCWFEVNTPSADAAVSFYVHRFGGEPKAMEGMPTPYVTVHVDGRPRYGILQMNEAWEGVPPHWMVYFAVRDTDAAAAAVAAAGGKVCVAPFDTPAGRLVICEDPLGAVFTLIAPVG